MMPSIPLWILQLGLLLFPITSFFYTVLPSYSFLEAHEELNTHVLTIRNEILDKCRTLRQPPTLTSHFERDTSDRFENGTRPTLIRNATIFTGELNATGPVLVFGDILLDRGLVKEVGHVDLDVLALQGKNLTIINAQRAWITPGLSTSNERTSVPH